ncbi:hypothetical protein GE061_003108 [Apolygus lucorum]|uniref:Uncharacterized protein n=1 Tax=Apolygus lucorum TaxID=248454 RepID=A0A8S9X3N2_APOLU|nr:hypothetical protein GE061_003108 [Apolygus lucorum]
MNEQGRWRSTGGCGTTSCEWSVKGCSASRCSWSSRPPMSYSGVLSSSSRSFITLSSATLWATRFPAITLGPGPAS